VWGLETAPIRRGGTWRDAGVFGGGLERHDPALHVKGIIARLGPQFAGIPEAVIFPFNIPTISGFGASAGFNFLLQDRSGTLTVEELGAQTRTFLAEARQRPQLANLFTSFDPSYPQVKVELDREKARTLGVPINEVFQAMSAALGGAYVNDFNRFGRLFRVYVQADADYRRKPDDIGQIYVRSQTTGTMVPLSTLVTIREVPSTEITTRFNLFRSVEISGVPGRGYTSGQALAALEDVFAKTMPKEMGVAYSKLSYQEKVETLSSTRESLRPCSGANRVTAPSVWATWPSPGFGPMWTGPRPTRTTRPMPQRLGTGTVDEAVRTRAGELLRDMQKRRRHLCWRRTQQGEGR